LMACNRPNMSSLLSRGLNVIRSPVVSMRIGSRRAGNEVEQDFLRERSVPPEELKIGESCRTIRNFKIRASL
jgi:hypothetical protein